MRNRAKELPEARSAGTGAASGEIGALLEKVLPQKAAMPHAMSAHAEDAILDLRPNASTLEKTGHTEVDQIAAFSHAWASLEQNLQGHRQLMITTGNEMMNLFRPDCSLAYPFVYKAVLACPSTGLTGLRGKLQLPRRFHLTKIWLSSSGVSNHFRAEWSFGYTLWN